MAGDSLANTLSFLQSQITGNREIPAASDEFLQSARNPNIRNFAPGQQPQFQSPILQMLMGGAGGNQGPAANVNAPSLALQQPQQGGNGLIRALGLSGVESAMSGRQNQLQQILQQAGAQ